MPTTFDAVSFFFKAARPSRVAAEAAACNITPRRLVWILIGLPS